MIEVETRVGANGMMKTQAKQLLGYYRHLLLLLLQSTAQFISSAWVICKYNIRIQYTCSIQAVGLDWPGRKYSHTGVEGKVAAVQSYRKVVIN